MFDFQSYVERREANPGRKSIRLQNYAYIDDIENLREIADNEIICQAVSLGLQAWQFAEGKKLRKSAKDVDKKLERVSLAWKEVCFQLGHSGQMLKIIPTQENLFEVYGDNEGTLFVISGKACNLSTPALKFLFGRGLGALDNGHVPYLTLQRFFDSATRGLWGKAVQIPESLLHWRRSAEITKDRAGILASRDISAAILVIMQTSLDWDVSEIMREIRRYHDGLDVDWGEPEIEKRVRAIECFMKSRLYLRSSGLPMSDVDKMVQDIYRVL